MKSIDSIELEELGDQICELSAHIAAATYRWLRLLAEFDRRRGWAQWGCHSCAHWLNWRCGLDLRSGREKARVARALDDLPLVCEAFSRGEVSYSKVRAITRIASPATEKDLLMFAQHAPTSHVERIVRSYRKCVPGDASDDHDRRRLEVRYDDDGSVIVTARLAPEEGALVLKALEKLRAELSSTNRIPGGPEDGSAEPPKDRADAFVHMARRELAGEKGSSGDKYTVMVHADVDVFGGGDGACHIEDGSGISAETLRRLTCDGSLVAAVEDGDGKMLNIGRKTRTIPTAIRRALKIRDGGCRFPGCTHRAYVDGHHIKHWSHGGETSLSNLVLLCSFHHRLIHDGKARIQTDTDGRFTFVRKDGRVIETAALSVEPGGVEKKNDDLRLPIGPETAVPRWYRYRWDLGVAIEA